MGRPAVSVIIVAYNSAPDLRALLPMLADPQIEVVVVDNASADGGADVATAAGATVIASAENLGWTRGGNLGAERATAPVLAFVNPDARPSAADLLRLAKVLSTGEVAATAPRFLDVDTGEPQAFYFRFPDPVSGLFCFFGVGARLDELIGRPFMRRRTYQFAAELPGEVEQPGAACLVVGADTFRELGRFDESMFLFFSDTDFCRRLAAAGKTLRVAWDVPVRHQGGGSVGALDPFHRRMLLQRDYLAYARVNYGWFGRAITVLAVVVLTGVLPAIGYLLRGSPRRARDHAATARRILRR